MRKVQSATLNKVSWVGRCDLVALGHDSQHVAYTVYENQGKKGFVVVDGIEGRVYDSVSKLGFDSLDRQRYNAVKGDSLYLVEETIK